MTVREAQDEILRLKKEKDFCILAHVYQSRDILEIADYKGDSYGLSVQASKTENKNVIMCGVRFMAETCKILSPDKTVFLPNPVAGCPMAEQMSVQTLREFKKKYPDYATVAYVNTTSELKAECDVCVTSSSAVKICKAMPENKILFIPDPNLGNYVAEKLPEKEFAFYDGGCPRHKSMTDSDVQKSRQLHPKALLLVHPECPPEVVKNADFVGSTTEIMSYAKNSGAKEFIIGTENSIVEHLQYDCPDKEFYPLSVNLFCPEMRVTTLMDIIGCMNGTSGEKIELNDEVMTGAKRCIERMIALGG
ncbi:MAG: quinolinate synthase NadA [Clostridia bacterium]|nr:quinolinate synthase NadA [Clostridia bacterium]